MASITTPSRLNVFAKVMNDQSDEVRSKIIAMYIILALFNVVLWGVAFLASVEYPVILGTGLLAFTFGLRPSTDRAHSRSLLPMSH